MKVETKVFLSGDDLNVIDNFGDLIRNICREIECTNKCPLNYKQDVCHCGHYEMSKMLQHLKYNTFLTTES